MREAEDRTTDAEGTLPVDRIRNLSVREDCVARRIDCTAASSLIAGSNISSSTVSSSSAILAHCAPFRDRTWSPT